MFTSLTALLATTFTTLLPRLIRKIIPSFIEDVFKYLFKNRLSFIFKNKKRTILLTLGLALFLLQTITQSLILVAIVRDYKWAEINLAITFFTSFYIGWYFIRIASNTNDLNPWKNIIAEEYWVSTISKFISIITFSLSIAVAILFKEYGYNWYLRLEVVTMFFASFYYFNLQSSLYYRKAIILSNLPI